MEENDLQKANEAKTFKERVWDLIMYLMWLPILTAKSWTSRVIGWVTTLYLFIEPMIKRAWDIVCDVSPKLATYAEKVPCIGKHLAWGLNLPPRLDLLFLLEKALSLIKKKDGKNQKKTN